MTILAAWLLFAQEGPEIVGVRDRLWFPSLGGDIQVSSDAVEGTTIDVDETFDFGKPELFNDLSAWVNVPLLIIDRVNAGFWFGGYREDQTVTETFTFGDQTFTAGADFTAILDMKVFTASLEKFVFSLGPDELGVALGVQLGAKYFDIDVEVSSDALGVEETEELRAPIPIAGARVIGQATPWLRLEGELNGIYVVYGGFQGYYVEFMAEIAFQPIKQIMIGVGYKLVLFSVEDTANDEFDVDLRMSGFFVVGGVKF